MKRMSEISHKTIEKIPFYETLEEYANEHGDKEGFLTIDDVLNFFKQKDQKDQADKEKGE